MTEYQQMPEQFTAGDTLIMERDLPEYPADDGWQLQIVLVNAAGQILLTGTATPEGLHRIEQTSADTASWAAGKYAWTEQVSKGTERYTLNDGAIEIEPDFAAQTDGYDARSPWEKILEQLESAYRQMSAGQITTAKVSFNNREVTYRSLEELIKAINHARQQVAREQNEEAVRKGYPTGNRIHFRF